MRKYLKGEYYDSGFLLSAFAAWGLSAALLLLISSIILSELGCSEQSIGYASSLISFLSAFAAGIAASRKRKNGLLYTSLLTATVLVTALLTLGFIINGSKIEPSAILSIISFTFAGCVAGVVACVPVKQKKHYKPRI